MRFSFFGPQYGCSRRKAITASRTASGVRCGLRCGRRLRSTSGASGVSQYRFHQVSTVVRLTPYSRASPAFVASPLTNRSIIRVL
jgi:hypothetical protein